MNMVDGVLLLVDAVEGPMPQTKFVLRQALQRGLNAIVVVNKIDRANARTNHVINATFDLFIDLGATEEQAEFPIVYTNALTGVAGLSTDEMSPTLEPLFEKIIGYLQGPDVDVEGPTQLQATLLGYDDYKGKIVIGRLNSGMLRRGQSLVSLHNGDILPLRAGQVFTHVGLQRVEVEQAEAGDIVALTGINDVGIGDTLADPADPRPLPPIKVEEPTVRMTFGVNTSPFSGREGTYVTSRKIRERLMQGVARDVALRVEDTDAADTFWWPVAASCTSAF